MDYRCDVPPGLCVWRLAAVKRLLVIIIAALCCGCALRFDTNQSLEFVLLPPPMLCPDCNAVMPQEGLDNVQE